MDIPKAISAFQPRAQESVLASPPRATRNRKTNCDAALDAAHLLLHEAGLEGVTMRKLADRLNVNVSALYWHFKNKDALIEALAELLVIQSEAHYQPASNESWCVFLYSMARKLKNELVAIPDGARLCAFAQSSARVQSITHKQHAFLRAQGFSDDRAEATLSTIRRYVLGYALLNQERYEVVPISTLTQTSIPTRKAKALNTKIVISGLSNADSLFEFGLKAIINGIGASN